VSGFAPYALDGYLARRRSCLSDLAKLHPRQPFFGARMPHRGCKHANRRRFVVFLADEGTNTTISDDFDDVRYDDVMPRAHRLRGTLVLDEEGEIADLNDLRAERRLI
jgi:hypothetical protein